MKKSKILVLALVLVFVLVLATACDGDHQHAFGDWTLTTNPTETATGVAKRTCACGESEIKNDVPALSDTATWTKQETPATHATDGSAVYTSVYGTVTVVLPKGEGAHTYVWTIDAQPSLKATGFATGVCACGDTTTAELPVLTDTSVWTKDAASTDATCVQAGKGIYTSVYGTVDVVINATGEHTWGNWTLTTNPTLTTLGAATRSCANCDATETDEFVPTLADASVWTKDAEQSVASSCTEAGKDVYTSVYGTVEVATALAAHTPAEAWESDETGHWHNCANCGVAGEKQAHSIDGVRGTCADCGFVKTAHAGTEADPFDVADALLVVGQLAVTTDSKNPILSEKVWVAGVVVANASYNTQYNNFNSFNIADKADSSATIMVYRSWGDAENKPYKGDTIVVAGYLENYNGTKEITYSENVQNNVTFEIVSRGAATVTAEAEHATVNLSANSGKNCDTFTFTVVVENGYELASVKVDGSVVEAVDGVYTAIMAGDTKVVVDTTKAGAAAPTLAATLELTAENGTFDAETKIQVFAANGITVTNKTTANELYANPARFYKNSTYTITYTEEIAKIVIYTDTNTKYSIKADDACEGGTLVVDGSLGVVTVNPGTKSVTLTATANQVRVSKIEVYAIADDNVHTHDWSEWTVTTPATCTTVGSQARTCSACGESETKEIAKLAHTEVTDAAVAATCTTTGLTAGSHCSVCGIVLTAQTETEKIAHDFQVISETAATCAVDGLKISSCSVCDEMKGEVLPQLPEHTWGDEIVVNATCTVVGYTSHKCSVCGASEKVETPALGHSWGAWNWVEIPTLETIGEATHKCGRCGVEEGTTVPALTDTTVWTVSNVVESTYNTPEVSTFTSEFGTTTAITAAKLVAPYDGKTYKAMEFAITDEGKLSPHAWTNASLTVDASGVGTGEAHPFRGKFVFEMVNPATGEIKITEYGIVSNNSGSSSGWGDDEDDWYGESEVYALVPTSDTTYTAEPTNVYTCWIDMETGTFVMPGKAGFSAISYIAIATDDELTAASFNACTFAGNMAISYHNGEVVNNMFITSNRVYLGVTFQADKEVATNELANCNLITVSNSAGEVINTWAKDANGAFVVADGLQGTYNGVLGKATLSGSGIATLETDNGELVGTYVIGDVIGVYIGGCYYEITLSEGNYAGTMPMVNVTLDLAGIEVDTATALTVNKNIAITLPVLTTDEKQLKGWSLDAEGTQLVSLNYLPTADVTLHAVWADKVVVNFVGVKDGDNTTALLCAGDIIGDYLPNYALADIANNVLTLNSDGTKYFAGWYLDEDFEFALPVDAEVTAEDTGITVYAKWADLGSYKVSDENSAYTFVYDKTNQWWASNNQKKGSSSANIYVVATGAPVVVEVTYWIDSEKSWDFLQSWSSSYDGKIYGDSMINTKGYSYTQATAQTKTYYLENNAKLKLTYSKDSNGDTGKDTAWLILKINGEVFVGNHDGLQGTYTGASNLVVDGLGDLTIGNDARIAYEIANRNETSATLAIRTIEDGVEVYKEIVLDLENNTYTISAPTVTIVLNTEVGATGWDYNTKATNKNVGITLPTMEEVGYTFRGWFVDRDCTQAAELVDGKYVPAANVTLFAKWDAAVTVSYNYHNGSANTNETKYFNDTLGTVLGIGSETNGNLAFVGWFTKDGSENGDWGTAVTENLVLSSDLAVDGVITLHAQWVLPYVMEGTYVGWNFCGTSSGTKSSLSVALTITSTGLANKSGSYGPVNLQIAPEYREVTDGVIYFGEKWYAYYNDEYGMLWYKYNGDANGVGNDTMLVVRKDTFVSLDFSGKVIDGKYVGWVTLTYVKDGANEVVNIFLYNNKIYTDVTWNSGVSAKECSTKDIDIVAADGTVFVKTGNTISTPDSTRGTYTNTASSATVFLNGVGGVVVDGTTYALTVIDAEANKFGVTTAAGYAEYTFDYDAHTYTVAQPTVTLTFVTEFGQADAVVVNKNVAVELPALTHEGYLLVGWFTDEACTSAAKLTSGKFVVEADTTLYAKWVVPYAMMGTYYGYNFYNVAKTGTVTGLGNKTTVTELGVINGYGVSNVQIASEYANVTDGVIYLGQGYYAYYNSIGILWYGFGKYSSSVGTDTRLLFDASKVKSVDVSACFKYDGHAIGWATLTLVDGSKTNVFLYNDVVYANVSWPASITPANATTSDFAVYAADGSLIAVKKGNAIVLYDGYEGITYTGALNGGESTTIVADGAGKITIGTEVCDYTIVDASADKVLIVVGNRQAYITLNKASATFTQVADGIEGTYTLPEGGTIALDGFGTTNNGGTYVVSGTNISIYNGADIAVYGIDVANKALLGKSIFAGLVFSGSIKTEWESNGESVAIRFDDAATLTGSIWFGYNGSSEKLGFTAEINGSTIVFTITSSLYNNSDSAGVLGRTYTFSISGNKMTFVSGTVSRNTLKLISGSVVCADM